MRWAGIRSCCCVWPVEVPEASLINWLPVSAAQHNKQSLRSPFAPVVVEFTFKSEV